MRRSAIAVAVVATVLGVIVATVVLGRGDSGDGTAVATTAPAPPTKPRPRPKPATGRPTTDTIPILMYHVIADPPAEAPFPELYVSSGAFAGEVALARGPRLPRGHAAGRLRPLAARAPATAPSDRRIVRRRLPQPVRDRRADPATARLARGTQPGGAEHGAVLGDLATPGAHAHRSGLGARRTHADAPRPDDTRPGRARAGGLRLAGRSTRHVRRAGRASSVTPPAGSTTPLSAAVRSAGYLGATTTAPGLATPGDLFRLNRVRVDRSDGVAGLAAKLKTLGS